MSPQVIPGEVKRIRPRVYQQKGEVVIQAGDQLVLAQDFRTIRATSPEVVTATRKTRKDGTPRGPWLFSYATIFLCRLESERRER